MRKFVSLSVAAVGILFLSGCTSSLSKSLVPKMDMPKQEVAVNETRYDVALHMIGDMLYEIGDPDIYIFVKPIVNKTTGVGKVPEDITGMLKSAFMNMGYKVRVIADPNAHLPDETYIIEGEISEFDAIRAERSGFNVGVAFGRKKGESEGEAESDYEYKEIRLGLDLRAIKASTGEYVPFAFSKNKIIIKKISDSNKIGFSIAGNGFGLSGAASVKNGVHSSLRLLSESSAVELLGKIRLLPYWLAIPNAVPEYQVINNFKRKFMTDYDPQKRQVVVYYLLEKFYPNIKPDSFGYYVKRFKEEYGVFPEDSSINADLFAKLLIELPRAQKRSAVASERRNLLRSTME